MNFAKILTLSAIVSMSATPEADTDLRAETAKGTLGAVTGADCSAGQM